MLLTAETILSLAKISVELIAAFKGKAKFADGTVLDESHVAAVFSKADLPWARIEDRAKAELAKLGIAPPTP